MLGCQMDNIQLQFVELNIRERWRGSADWINPLVSITGTYQAMNPKGTAPPALQSWLLSGYESIVISTASWLISNDA